MPCGIVWGCSKKRKRREDIISLARHLVEKTAVRLGMTRLRLDSTTLDCLSAYAWPGNVRELENALERAAVLCKDGVIHLEDLPVGIVRSAYAPAGAPLRSGRSLQEVEHRHILAVLESVGGNRSQAAQVLGISPATLWRRLKTP
ncbi:MAG: AAA-type ATPase lid domain-containing protein [Pirellulaceae bacterium]